MNIFNKRRTEKSNKIVNPVVESSIRPHICEDTIKLATLEYDVKRKRAMEDWTGPSAPYRIRPLPREGTFIVERSVEEIPPVGDAVRDAARNSYYATQSSLSGVSYVIEDGRWEANKYVLYMLKEDPTPPFSRWQPLAHEFPTFKSAAEWLKQFVNPAHGAQEFNAGGVPVTSAKPTA